MSTSPESSMAGHHPLLAPQRRWRRRVAMMSAVAMSSALCVIGAGPATVQAADPVTPTVDLGIVESFGVLTPAAVGNAANIAGSPPTMIRGDLGAGGAITGFASGWGVVTGAVVNPDVSAQMVALEAAYDNAKGRPEGAPLAADLGGENFGPGVHTTIAATGTAAGGSFTIDGQGNPDAVFIFQIGGALSLGANTTMTLINEAQAKNVFWAVTGAGGLGAPTHFVGTLMAGTAVSAGAGSTINGRLTSLTGAVTMGATQLYSAPPSMYIVGGGATSTTTSTPVITGTTSARSPMTVTIVIDNVTQTPTLTPSESGVWSFQSPPLANGAHTIVARTVDAVDNVGSYTQVLTVDTTLPVVSIDDGPVASTNDLTPTISGDTDVAAGNTVTLTMTRTDPHLILTRTALVQADSSWSISPNGFTAGEWTLVAAVTDPAGNPGSFTQMLTVDAVAPAAAITSNSLTNDPTPTISGTAETDATVAVSINGLAVAVTQGENWSATATTALGHGNHNVSVTATDTVGNSTVLTQTLNVDLVLPLISINPGATDTTSDATPTIAGTTDVALGVTVSVSIDDGPALTALVQADGWNVTPSTDLTPGDHTVVATVTDPAGNIGSATQTLTLDIADPTVIIDGGSSLTTPDVTPTITGSSPDVPVGSPVTVTVAGQTLTTAIQSNGTFSVTAAAIAPNGTYFVFVTVIDAAGNDGVANQSLTINAIAPTVTFTNGPTATTNDATPLIGGSSNAPVGSPVVVTVAAQTLHATVQPGGSWNVTTANLSDGDATVVASVTGTDGNAGTATQTLTIDTVAPVVVIGGGDRAVQTTDPTPDIAGSGATAGSAVMVTVAGQTMTTTVGSDGTWTVTPPNPLPAGDNTVSISITDPAGNTGTGRQVITVSPAPPVTNPPVTDPPITNPPAAPDHTPVGPKRVFDTRVGQSPNALRDVAKRQVAGGYELEVKMTDIAGFVPATGVGAVSLNVTSTESAAAGFLTVYACGTREVVSSVNFPAGKTVANAVITPVSASGTVCFYANTPTDIIVDINGWFAAGAAFSSVGPKRVFDTRPGESPDAVREVTKSKLAANTMMEVRLTDLTGYVPAAGVSSVSLNVVVTEPEAAGFITVYSCGNRALVSSVNFVAGQTVANAVIAPVSANGTVCFYTLANTHLIVDINGWLEAGSRFTGVDPARILDTRPGESTNALREVAKTKIGGGNVLEVKVTNLAGVVPAAGVSAVSLNVTATNTEGGGFVTVFACGTMEEVSSLNYEAGSTVANAVLAPVSAMGTICLFSNQLTDVIVDINGWIGTAT